MTATARKPKNNAKRRRGDKLSAYWRKLLCALPKFNPFKHTGGATFIPDLAEQAIAFIEQKLTHIEGALAEKPFILEMWQKAIVANTFGWVRWHEKFQRWVRRFRELFIYVPRKNGKTPLVACIDNTVMFTDGEMGAQGFGLAASGEQATYLFRQMKGHIKNDSDLGSRAEVFGGDAGVQRRIVYRDTDGYFEVQSADANTKHGGNSHLAAIDELHAQPNRDLVETIRTSFASENRVQPLFIMLTTADFDRPSICNEVYDYACKVRDGIIVDPAFLPVIYEAPRDADWRDPEVWAMANPNLGISVSREYLERECKRAQEQPVYENTFKRLHLNMRTEQDVRIIPMDVWDRARPGKRFDMERFRGRRCYGGLDLASREDLASASFAFPDEDGEIDLISLSWCPEDRVRDRAKKRIPYDQWARDGWMTATPGNIIDHRRIREDIIALRNDHGIIVVELGYDPKDATEIVQNLQDIDGFTMVECTQGFPNLSAPTKELISRLKARTLRPDRNPVLRWAASNMAVHFQGRIPVGQDIGEYLDKVPIMPSKRNSADKIDPITAAVIALWRLLAHPDQLKPSVYESRGLLTL